MLNSNMVITNKNKDDTVIHGNIDTKEGNESVNNDTGRVMTKAWPKGTCLVTGDFILGHIDETRMSSKFKVKVRPFPGAKNRRHVSLPCVIARKNAGLRYTSCWYK